MDSGREYAVLREAVWGGTASVLRRFPAQLEDIAKRAAVVHWFDPPILDALAQGDVGPPWSAAELFQKFAELPFVEPYPGGQRLCFHELTREAMNDRLWCEDRALYRTASAWVANYYRARADSDVGLTPEETVELAYHELVVDERSGIDLIESLFAANVLSSAILEALLRAVAEHCEHGRVSPATVVRTRLWSLWAAANGRRHPQVLMIGDELMKDADVPPDIWAAAASAVAESLLQTGERDDAGELYAKVVGHPGADPGTRVAALSGLGDISLDRGHHDDADDNYREALMLVVGIALCDPERDADDGSAEDMVEHAAGVRFADPTAWTRLRELIDLQEVDVPEELKQAEEESAVPLWCLAEVGGAGGRSQDEDEDGEHWRLLEPTPAMGDIWLKLGEVRSRRAIYDDAVAAYRLAWHLFEDVGDAEGALIAIGSLQELGMERGDLDTAKVWVDSQRLMFEHAERSGDEAAMLQALMQLASSYDRLDQIEDAQTHYERAATLAHDHDNVVIEASALEGLSNLFVRVGDREHARAPLERAMSLYQQAGLREGAIRMVLTTGDLERLFDHRDAAAEAYGEALRESAAAGIPGGRYDAHMGLAFALLEDGSLPRAAEEFECAAEDARWVGAPQRIRALLHAAAVRAQLGDQQAAALRNEAVELGAKFGLMSLVDEVLADVGEELPAAAGGAEGES
ncbi:MAG: hypothetical protein ACRD0C_16595 [Acidimicrobiia bacterium]